MSSKPVVDFLTKQLSIDRNVVTYRSLSRELLIPVNDAKNELTTYHRDAPSQSAATYLLSGQPKPTRRTTYSGYNEDGMEVDDEYSTQMVEDNDGYDDDESEEVPQTLMLLVGERELDQAKARFEKLNGIHVYCLSPVPLHDADLICSTNDIVREIDNSDKGRDAAKLIGRVIGENVKANPAKVKAALASVPTLKSKKDPKAESDIKGKGKDVDLSSKTEKLKLGPDPPKEKPKPTGKLDFSRAKAKEMKKEETKQAQTEPAQKAQEPSSRKKYVAGKVEVKQEPKQDLLPKVNRDPSKKDKIDTDTDEQKEPQEHTKRGLKRKSIRITSLDSDPEDADHSAASSRSKPPSETKTSTRSRVRKGVIVSEDDDEDLPARHKGKKSVVPPKGGRKEVAALMDVDEAEVVKASRQQDNEEQSEKSDNDAEDSDNGDLHMDDGTDPVSKPKRKPRKPKKVVPVGRNGLKKKRVVKSRTKMDEKGYMVTEDYSSYESVDEEEVAPEPPAKGKGKAKAAASKKGIKDAGNEETVQRAPTKSGSTSAKAKLKPSGASKGGGQKSLATFFGPATATSKK